MGKRFVFRLSSECLESSRGVHRHVHNACAAECWTALLTACTNTTAPEGVIRSVLSKHEHVYMYVLYLYILKTCKLILSPPNRLQLKYMQLFALMSNKYAVYILIFPPEKKKIRGFLMSVFNVSG